MPIWLWWYDDKDRNGNLSWSIFFINLDIILIIDDWFYGKLTSWLVCLRLDLVKYLGMKAWSLGKNLGSNVIKNARLIEQWYVIKWM